MSKTAIEIAMYIFEAFVLLHYANTLFEPKYKKIVSFISAFAVNLILFLIYHFQTPSPSVMVNLLCISTLYTMFIYLMYKTTLKTALFHMAIFDVVMFATEIITNAISNVLFKDFFAFENQQNVFLYAVVCSKLMYFTVMMLIMKAFASKVNKEDYNKYYWLLFFVPFSSMLMMISFWYIAHVSNTVKLPASLNVLVSVASILMLFANILVFAIYEYSITNANELYELKAMERQEEQDKIYYSVIEQSNNDMRIFAHNIKNHLAQIRNLDNTEEIHSYVDKLVPDIISFSNTGKSKNKMLDLILNKYLMLCESKSIKFDIDVKTANLSSIDDVDLSTLMNNLLDNALESAAKEENGYIELKIFTKNESYEGLVLKNSCSVAPKQSKNKLLTTKSDSKLHGMGITSIKKVLKKYNAVYDWKYDEVTKTFETNIAFLK